MRLALGAAAAVAAIGLVGCSGAESDSAGDSDEEKAFAAVGGADSPCPLPFVFDRAQGWVPERLDPMTSEERATTDPDDLALLDRISSPGPFQAACELSSPINVGFLRVFAGPARLAGRDPEKILTTFIEAYDSNVSDIAFAEVSSEAGLALVEATYEQHRAPDDDGVPQRAFLVSGTDGVAVVHLGGLDAEEHDGMLPAYELARRSVRLAD